MFRRILIANRGEIACRIIRTAQHLGIHCVAVYSEADRDARHVGMADEAFLIGPAAASESYLVPENIINAAHRSGAEAIHPGYGFLSENAEFARDCEASGLVFIGPPAAAIATMGSKSAAKSIMEKAGVPLVPGYHGEDQSPETLRRAAGECGFPVLLKAVAGGGGKGMRVVNAADDFDDALAAARREAASAFGNTDMLVERYLERPRHIEIQVFCDRHGNALYLGERDCSIQRRHQKVLEEAPAPGLSQASRQAMGEAAVQAARAIDYVGAGTVEFLYEPDGSFYFMEMNTRLQVEHPVTEMVTAQDLVEWQLRVAADEPLPLAQADVHLDGHAIEARVYAEDPEQEFLPATGTLAYLRPPAETGSVRIDTGVTEGDAVTVHYDPMIAKLVVWGESRQLAINHLTRALAHYRIAGVTTNLGFLHRLVDSRPFREAELTTGFIDSHRALLLRRETPMDRHYSLALACGFFLDQAVSQQGPETDPWSPFAWQNSWRLNGRYQRVLPLLLDGQRHDLHVESTGTGYRVLIGETSLRLGFRRQHDRLDASIDDHHFRVYGFRQQDAVTLFHHGQSTRIERYRDSHDSRDGADPGNLSAPMTGTVIALSVQPGDRVTTGQTLMVMEAMKMEYPIKAPADGEVRDVFFSTGDPVSEGSELLALAIDDARANPEAS